MAETQIVHKNYFTDKNALSIPWIESPFFEELLDFHEGDYTDEEFDQLVKFHDNGFIKVDLGLTDDVINQIKDEIVSKLDADNVKTQDSRYHYNDSPRVFEAWKDCKGVLELARHPKILSILETLYGKFPLPFQTINFTKGSNQPLHSDSIHFHTIPHKWMVGVWVALEDMDENNGTLMYVPGSHKWDVYEFPDLNLEVPKFGEQFESYSEYENFLRQLVTAKAANIECLTCKKGTALIWAANLLHGGIPIKDPSRTCWAQAIHYYFPGCKYYFSPLFSDKHEGKWSEKNVEEKNILNHMI